MMGYLKEMMTLCKVDKVHQITGYSNFENFNKGHKFDFIFALYVTLWVLHLKELECLEYPVH